MAFLSDLLDKRVADGSGAALGKLTDVVVSQSAKQTHPVVTALVIKTDADELMVPVSDVAALLAPVIPLKSEKGGIPQYKQKQNDIFLARDVLDKQIIDTNGVRVVRVNDIELVRVNDAFIVANVDVGGAGLLRRLGLEKPVTGVAKRLKKDISHSVISWDNVEMLHPNDTVRLKVAGDRISDLHPADLAEIIADLNHAQSDRLLKNLDTETLAETLEEVEPDFQASLVRNLPDEKVADVLEAMAPDEAADLLAELPSERSADLLELMEDEEAEDVRKLLDYHEESAGGLMTTDMVTIPPELTAERAISAIRRQAKEVDPIFYVYVVEKGDRLVGVLTLRDLILARPKDMVRDFMHTRVVTVNPHDKQDDIGQVIAKYDLLAVPVVDEDQTLLGIVTSDDALDKVIPTAWKKRLPRFYY